MSWEAFGDPPDPPEACPDCDDGWEDEGHLIPCETCQGHGYLSDDDDGFYDPAEWHDWEDDEPPGDHDHGNDEDG